MCLMFEPIILSHKQDHQRPHILPSFKSYWQPKGKDFIDSFLFSKLFLHLMFWKTALLKYILYTIKFILFKFTIQ